MMVPPAFLTVKVVGQRRKRVRLWLPLFILWPLLLVLLVLALLITVLVDAALMATGRRSGYTRFAVGCLNVLGATRGVEVSVVDSGNQTVAVTVR